MKEYLYADIQLGQEESFEHTIRSHDLETFGELSGDKNPLHHDDEFAREKGFSSRVVFGLLLTAYFSRMVGMFLPGKHALYLSQEVIFLKPAFVGDSLVVKGTVVQKVDSLQIIVIKTQIIHDTGTVLVEGQAKVKCI